MSNNSISEHQKVIDHTDASTRKELVDIHALLIDGLRIMTVRSVYRILRNTMDLWSKV